MEQREPADERTRAHHEAGHAVAAYRLGVGIVRIHVVLSEERQGSVEYEPFDWQQPLGAARWREMLHRAVIYLAGREGEAAISDDHPHRVVDIVDGYWDLTQANYAEAWRYFAAGDFKGAADTWVGGVSQERMWAPLHLRRQVQQFDPNRLFRCVRKRAFALFTIEGNRRAVRALADALLCEKTLIGTQATKIIEDALGYGTGRS